MSHITHQTARALRSTFQISLLLLLSLFLGECNSSDKIMKKLTIADNNKDVLILADMIHNHLKQTRGRYFTVQELQKIDTLKRISGNFEKFELKTLGGYIAVHYTFSKNRNTSIELTDKEKEKINKRRWLTKNIDEPYDGAIQFAYGEGLFRILKIYVKPDGKM